MNPHQLRETLGYHLLVELYDCPHALLDDPLRVEAAAIEAARQAGVTIVQSVFHQFSPQGVSGVLVIAESHISVHTWPEKGYAAVDLFTCGKHASLEIAAASFITALGAQSHESKLIHRGLPTGLTASHNA